MKFTAALSVLLCTEAALGARFTEKRRQSRENRSLSKRGSDGKTRSSQPMIKSDLASVDSNETHVEYSSNWAGAVLISTGFTEVTGTVVVPTLATSSSKTESAGAAVSLNNNVSRGVCTAANPWAFYI